MTASETLTLLEEIMAMACVQSEIADGSIVHHQDYECWYCGTDHTGHCDMKTIYRVRDSIAALQDEINLDKLNDIEEQVTED